MPSEEPGTGDRKLEKDAEGGAEGGRAVFMVVEKAARPMHARVPRLGDR